MPKILCLLSLLLAVIITLLFGVDFLMSIAGMQASAPLRGASMLMDLGFTILGATLAVMSWLTFREQR